MTQRNRTVLSRAFAHCLEQLEGRAMLASISSTAPWNGQQSVGVSSNITVTFGSAMTASTISAETIKLRDASGNLVTNSLSYNTSTRVLTIDPSSNLVSNSSYYSVTVIGGAEGVKGSDNSTLAQTYQYYFTCGTPAFSEQAVFTGLTEPTNIEFSLNGRAFVAEKSGLIKTFDSIDDTSATITADLRTQVHNFWDRGLLGMAIDPNFDNGRPYLYVLYTRDADLGGNAPKFGSPGVTSDGGPNSTTDGANVSGRLSRLTIGANGVMTGSEQVIIDDWVNQFPSHSIGDLKFGPDGMLYASAGDGASFNAVDYGQLGINNFNDPPLEGGAVRSQDILTSGDPTGLDGTVIRINPDTGTGVAGSPYASSSDANNRRIVANGLRNPFRITFKPGTGELYIADTGWGAWEEINRIPNATDSIAENFGWPAYEGPVRQSGYDSANIPVLESFYANPSAHTTPWFAYSHSQQVIPGTAEPTGGSSPTGLAFYQGGSYPAAFDGALFFCDYSRGTTYVAFAGPDGQVNPNNRLMFALNRKPVELTVGPNGNIYMADMVNGAIRRYVATGYNNAPTAHIAADQTTGPVPLTVNFSGATSTDPDNDALIYEWDLDGDGQFDDSTSTTPSFTYTTIGDYSVKLRVTDAGGLSNIDTISINAGNTAPVPTMISPVSTLNWSVGQTINFSGSATDAQDGTLAGSSLSWSLVLLHGNEINNTTHEHPITSFTGESGSFQAPDHEYPSWIELRLTATDSNGLSSTISRRIDPQTVTLNFATNPSGLQIGLNSETLTAPFSKTVIVGSSNTITAVSPQTVGATTYLFTSWSDGGLGTHSYISPASPVTLSATFTAASLVKLSGTVIGTTGSNTTGNTRDKAFDGSLTTYFDAPTASGAWAGLDLGSAQTIQQIRYAPRADQAARMVGGKFQASNSADFSSGVIDLYTIESVPAVGSLTNASVASATGYRYVRYLSPANGYANVAEIEFYSAISASIPATPTYLVGWTTGTGNQLWWNDESSNETGFRIERRLGANGAWSEVATVGAGVRSFFDSPINPSSTYSYRVRAYNASGNSAFSNTIDVTTPGVTVTTPTAPSALTGTAISATTVRLAWTDNSTNESQFRIERRLPNGTFAQLAQVDANVTTFDDTTVSAATTYEYRILATNSAGNSAYSAIVSVTTSTTAGTPSAPSGLSAVVNSNFSVTLSWTDNSNNEASFQLERRYAGWLWENVWTIPANTNSYTDTTSIGNVKYEYRVRAVNPTGQSAYSNVVPVDTASTGVQPPIAPTSLTGSAQSATQVTLNWIDNSSDETGFRIERRLVGETFAQIGTTNANITTYLDTTTTAGKVYEYRVRAAGAGSTFSTYSNTATVTTPGGTGIPATPTSLIAAWLSSQSRVSLTWSDNSNNETAFKIERRYAGWIWEDLATVGANVTSYEDTSAFGGVVYEYRVIALGGGGPSAASNGATVSTV